MAFFRKGRNANFSILNGFSWHVPGIGGLFAMLGWFLAGLVFSNILGAALVLAVPGISLEYVQLVYPLMFLPAMVASKYISNKNLYFEEGFKVDSPAAESMNPWKAGLLCCLATFSIGYLMDLLNGLLPEMSDTWAKALEAMVGGNLLVNFLCLSIFAPFFEEWFIRGTLLRGLLNCKRAGGRRGYSPFWSIVATSAIFGLIHGNIWQALPAFAIGCLFGYVYYKTRSLKLTMLMHAFNNTLSLLMCQLLPDGNLATWADVVPAPQLYAIAAACLAVLILVVLQLRRIPAPSAWPRP